MKRFSYIIAVPFVLVFSSCEKKPDAFFSMNKSTYAAGDTVQLINASPSGSKFEWEMPDGTASADENPKYIIAPNLGFGNLSFKLTAHSKGHKKTSSTTNSATLIPASTFTFFNGTYSTTSVCRVQRYSFFQGSSA